MSASVAPYSPAQSSSVSSNGATEREEVLRRLSNLEQQMSDALRILSKLDGNVEILMQHPSPLKSAPGVGASASTELLAEEAPQLQSSPLTSSSVALSHKDKTEVNNTQSQSQLSHVPPTSEAAAGPEKYLASRSRFGVGRMMSRVGSLSGTLLPAALTSQQASMQRRQGHHGKTGASNAAIASSGSTSGGIGIAVGSTKQLNMASMKIVQKIKERRQSRMTDAVKEPFGGNFMLNPRGGKRLTWDMVVTAPLLIYLTVMMPFRLCFDNEPKVFSGNYWFEFLIDIVFLLDIMINLRTGFVVSGGGASHNHYRDAEALIEYDRKRVARHYLKTWLLPDIISGVPFALIELLFNESGGASSLKVIKVMRLLRFLKLTRLLKVEKVLGSLDRDHLDYIEDFFQMGNTRSAILMITLALKTGFICHLLACLWVLVGRISDKREKPNWINKDLGMSSDATKGGSNVGEIYLSAFYFCFTTMTSVGYGDITPNNMTERTYTIVLEFVGGMVFASIIAALTSVVTSMDMNTRKTAEQLDAVASFVAQRHFPEQLGRRIRRHFRHFYSRKSAINESVIFRDLSTSLRKEVSAYLVSELMGDVEIFNNMSPTLWPSLLPLLRPMRFEADEVVCKQTEECTEMYIILSGRLHGITHVSGENVARVRNIFGGDCVNIMCVLKIWNLCVETVIADSSGVETYAITSEDFASLFDFKDPMDLLTWEDMCTHEASNFKMGEAADDIEAPSIYGVPLYLCCFSTVVVTLVEARGLAAADMSGTSDPFIIVDLVDVGRRIVQPEGNGRFTAANEKEGDEGLNDSDVSDNTDEDTSRSISHEGQDRSQWHGLVKSNSAYQPHSRLGGIALQRTHTLMPGRDILDEEPELSTFPPSVSFDAKGTGMGGHFLFDGSISGGGTATKKNKPSMNNPRPLSRSLWRHRTATISRTLDPNWSETVRWTDIKNVPPKGVPFSRLALRVRIYDADYLGSDDFLGQVILRLDDLESTQRTTQNEQQKGCDSSEEIVQLQDGPSTISSPTSTRPGSAGKTSSSRSSPLSSTSLPAFSGDRSRRRSNLFNGGRQSFRSNSDERLGPFSTDHDNNLLGEAGCDTIVDAWYTLKDSSHEQQDQPMGQQLQITGSVRLRTFVKRAETDARSDEILRMSSTVGGTKRLLQQQRQSSRRIMVRESRGKDPSELHLQPETEKRHAQNSEEDAPKGEL